MQPQWRPPERSSSEALAPTQKTGLCRRHLRFRCPHQTSGFLPARTSVLGLSDIHIVTSSMFRAQVVDNVGCIKASVVSQLTRDDLESLGPSGDHELAFVVDSFAAPNVRTHKPGRSSPRTCSHGGSETAPSRWHHRHPQFAYASALCVRP